ncbi:MAG: glycoside hydrolase family 3 C-terminal domain-containing protein [Butyrivibrio sp.]|uniref:glycoside hydrolase family 3 C-terminal domain-containing protein n=1 Tax=Butyrivibrio sp. TaxID=28121 RepID=UPI0025BEDE96|nr:glycoside hydrolase family 3 C-terminal domain-containing protein [Butyrivibrio sp.]MBQ6589616.1 glycoside hydrolase family 3 C-terminal domain-containing protein [Butyrivibrio sp.]
MEKWARIKYTPNLPLGEGGVRVTASQKHIDLSCQAACEGMVLLKNDRNVLPLRKGTRVALFGKGVFDYVKGGGGSGDVTVPYIRNLYEGLSQYTSDISIYDKSVRFYQEYIADQYRLGIAPGMIKEPALPEDILADAAAYADTAIIAISRFSGEGWDRKVAGVDREIRCEAKELVEQGNKIFDHGDFYLTIAEKKMVRQVKENFANVIVVMNVGGVVDTTWFKDDDAISSVLMAWQGGIEGGLAAAKILLGKVNPSGKLSDTFAARLEDYPSTDGFHENDDYVDYTEDIYVGYRYFETIPGAASKVNYPFGYGLSYTTFAVEDCKAEAMTIEAEGSKETSELPDAIVVSANVTNIGKIAGKEVVQLYYSAPQGKLGKPSKVLGGYVKTRFLQPGESQRVTIALCVEDMTSYDDLGKVKKAAWILEKGEYKFFLGTSVRDVKELDYTYELKKNVVIEQVKNRLVPTSLKKRMLADGSFEELPQLKPVDTYETIFPRPKNWKDKIEHDVLKTPVVRPQERFQLFLPSKEGDPKKFIEVAECKITLEDFMKQLSNEQLGNLLGGQPNVGMANTFGYGNLPEVGVPSAQTCDGPAGVRIAPEVGVVTTAFPCSTLLACTWNEDICYEVGVAGGAEAKECNFAAWLTPAVNIHRSPLCGRNFEYYSEDPFLAGKQAAAMVRGIQSNNIIATPKHFALNNKESNRKASDSRASERAIREIYLKAFEIIVKEAEPWSIMSSYNVVNGQRASESYDLLTGILRDEWGFEGVVVSDWWGFGEHYKEVLAGNDIKMGCGYTEQLLEAIDKKALKRKDLETSAERVLKMLLKLD